MPPTKLEVWASIQTQAVWLRTWVLKTLCYIICSTNVSWVSSMCQIQCWVLGVQWCIFPCTALWIPSLSMRMSLVHSRIAHSIYYWRGVGADISSLTFGVHCMMLSSISGCYLVGNSSTSPPPTVTIKNVSMHCIIRPGFRGGEQNWPWLRTSGLPILETLWAGISKEQEGSPVNLITGTVAEISRARGIWAKNVRFKLFFFLFEKGKILSGYNFSPR